MLKIPLNPNLTSVHLHWQAIVGVVYVQLSRVFQDGTILELWFGQDSEGM